MEKIRLLVVDDSLVIRRALRECFRGDPEIEVVGVAETGVRALEQIADLKPDVVTLDIEMPEMDGLETLKVLRKSGLMVPIIMFSKYTAAGATATLEALELGASDAVEKPEAHGGKGASCDLVKRMLTSRIRALGRRAHRDMRLAPSQSSVRVAQADPLFSPLHEVEAIGIAISTGGPKALIEIMSNLSPDLLVPIFITQHMPPMFARFLAERLSARGVLPAVEAEHEMVVKPGTIYIAPGDFHMEIGKSSGERILKLSQAPAENSCRPSADVMFRSLASTYGTGLLGLVMTGMGQDGRKGCEHVKAHGGSVVAQDEESSLVWGMPRAVITAGLQDTILPLSDMAAFLNRCCSRVKEKN